MAAVLPHVNPVARPIKNAKLGDLPEAFAVAQVAVLGPSDPVDDADRALVAQMRGNDNKLRYAVQLGTVRYLGTFLETPIAVPEQVLLAMAKQLQVEPTDNKSLWSTINARRGRQQTAEIREVSGYVEFTDSIVAFRLSR